MIFLRYAPPMLAIALVCIALTFCSPLRLRSQIFPQDVRLSVDPVQLVLPEHAQIQSAARIGNLTLVVWGSTRAVSDDSAANVLYWQAIQDTVKLGTPQILTSPEAFPYDYVQVVPLENRFLVVWNDRRNGRPSTYTTLITIGGARTPEERLWDGHALTASGVHHVKLRNKRLLLWNDTSRGEIAGRYLHLDGSFYQDPFRVDTGYVVSTTGFVPGSDVCLVQRSELEPLLCHLDGTFHSLPASIAHKFQKSYHLTQDASVLTVDSGIVREFRSALDTLPIREIIFPASQISWNHLQGSHIVGRDREGRLWLSYTSIETHGQTNSYTHWIREYRITQLGVDSFSLSKETSLNALYVLTEAYNGLSYDRNRLSRSTRHCSGVTEKFIVLDHTVYFRSGGESKRPTSMYVVVYPDTSMTRATHNTGIHDHNHPTIQCPHHDELQTRRRKAKVSREVEVLIGNESIRLDAPVAAVRQNVPERSAGLARDGVDFQVSWLAYGLDTTATTIRWNGGGQPDRGSPHTVQLNYSPFSPHTFYSLRSDGQHSTLALVSTVKEFDSSNAPLHQRLSLQRATSSGWRKFFSYDTAATTPPLRPSSLMRDPNDGSLLFSFGRYDNSGSYEAVAGIRLRLMNASGAVIWERDHMPLPTSTFVFLPIADRRFICRMGTHRLVEFDDTVAKASYDFNFGAGLSVSDFDNGAFLWYHDRMYRYDPESDTFTASVRVHLEGGYGPSQMLLNPIDSSVILLYRWDYGIRARVFSKDLLKRFVIDVNADSLEGYGPAGSFRNDTLYVVWEDRREGTSSIYGNAVTVPTDAPSNIRDRTVSYNVCAVTPNPARDYLSVTLSEPARQDDGIELFDALGRHVRSFAMSRGSSYAQLAIDDLLPGAYTARIRCGHGTEHHRIVVVR